MKKKIISVFLILTLVLCSLSAVGCGKKNKNENNQNQNQNNSQQTNSNLPDKQAVTNVYKSSSHKFPEGIKYPSNIFFSNDTVYITGYSYDENWNQSFVMCSYDTKTGTYTAPKEIELPKSSDGNDEYVGTVIMAEDGTLWGVSSSYFYEPESGYYEELYYLKHWNKNLKVASSVSLSDVLKDKNSDEGYSYHYVSKIIPMKNNIFALYDQGGQQIVLYDIVADTPERSIPLERAFSSLSDYYVQNVSLGSDGNLNILVITWGEDYKTLLFSLDIETMNISEPIDFAKVTGSSPNSIMNGPGYDFYYSNDDGIYGYDNKTETSTLLLNYINSDMLSYDFDSLFIASPDKFFATNYEYNEVKKDGEYFLNEITRVPDDQVVPKYLISLGGAYIPYSTKRAVLKFNKQSNEYRITVKDYSNGSYDLDTSELNTLINNDILAGTQPDILLINDSFSVDSFNSKGVFADINELMNKDASFNRNDYLTNIFDAYSTNGKQYQIATSFTVETLLGKESVLGKRNGWTMDEYLNFANSLPEDSKCFNDITRDTMLRMFFYTSFDTFIDSATGKCNFNSPEFKKMLEYVKSLPTKTIWEEMEETDYDDSFWTNYDEGYASGTTALYAASIYDFSELYSIRRWTFQMKDDSENIVIVGYPNSGRQQGIVNSYDSTYSICSKCKVKEGAWEFIKYLMSDEFYESNNVNGFSVKLSVVENMAKKALEEEYRIWDDYDYIGGGLIYDGLISPLIKTITTDDLILTTENADITKDGNATEDESATETADAEGTGNTKDGNTENENATVTTDTKGTGSTKDGNTEDGNTADDGEYNDGEYDDGEYDDGEYDDGDGEYDDGDGGYDDGDWGYSEPNYTIYHIPQSDIDAVMKLLKSITHRAAFNDDIYKMVSEESAYYFDNKKSVDEVAKVLQSRVQLYISVNE